MEWPVIVLGIIIIILIYVLYVYFVSKSSVISKSANLKEGNSELQDMLMVFGCT